MRKAMFITIIITVISIIITIICRLFLGLPITIIAAFIEGGLGFLGVIVEYILTRKKETDDASEAMPNDSDRNKNNSSGGNVTNNKNIYVGDGNTIGNIVAGNQVNINSTDNRDFYRKK